MGFDQPENQRQPQSGAVLILLKTAVDLAKFRHRHFNSYFVHADPYIRHGEIEIALCADIRC